MQQETRLSVASSDGAINMDAEGPDSIQYRDYSAEGLHDSDEEPRLFNYTAAAEYCDLAANYFKNQHKEGNGPSYVKPSERRVYFTREALDQWMATRKVVTR